MTFATLGVRPRTLGGLERQGITEPLPVQRDAIPALLTRADVVIEAPTGSGKTLAFAVPMIERLAGHRPGGPRALIVAPTRELAAQIFGVIGGVDPGLHQALLLGGVGYGPQLAALKRHADVVVGCPGRLLDLAQRGELRLGSIEYVVLDEADEMLDQGFARDVERILAQLPPSRGGRVDRQTVLASATMPAWVQTMIDKHLTAPTRVRVEHEQEPQLEHGLLQVEKGAKLAVLGQLLDRHDGPVIVFHRTKHGAKRLARDLRDRGHRAVELQGNLSQNARDRAIGAFRHGEADVLVATNVAARGIDVEGVELVVNAELPETAQWLTHRAGRTARNGRAGVALTLLAEEDMEQWTKLRRLGAPALRWVSTEEYLRSGQVVVLDLPAPGEPGGRGRVSGDVRPPMRGGVSGARPSGRRDGQWSHSPARGGAPGDGRSGGRGGASNGGGSRPGGGQSSTAPGDQRSQRPAGQRPAPPRVPSTSGPARGGAQPGNQRPAAGGDAQAPRSNRRRWRGGRPGEGRSAA